MRPDRQEGTGEVVMRTLLLSLVHPRCEILENFHIRQKIFLYRDCQSAYSFQLKIFIVAAKFLSGVNLPENVIRD